MTTDELIAMLATGAGPSPRAVAARRLVPAALLGVLCSALGALWLLGPIPAAMLATPAPWIKLGYATSLALAGGWLAARLARPVAALARPRAAVLAVAAVMGLLGALSLWDTPPAVRAQALLGHSWLACPWNVLGLSLPALGLALWALRGLAPTRPRLAGMAAGLLAGAAGACGYALACTEASSAFVAAWYTLGIGLTAGLGAWLGPRALRW